MYVAVAAIGGAAVSAWSSNKSASAVSGGTKRAAAYSYLGAERERQYQKRLLKSQRSRMKPWTHAGKVAVKALERGIRPGGEFTKQFGEEDFAADPGYEFRLSEGIKARERSAAARGGLLGGAQLKGLERYSQGVASEEYGKAYGRFQGEQQARFNRLASLSGAGQTTLQNLGGFAQGVGQTTAQLTQQSMGDIGSAQLAGAQARASAYQGYGQAAGQALGGLAYGAQQLGQNQPPQPVQPAQQWTSLNPSNYYR
ncbi:hypothetical protein [Sulfurovum sp.]|uniref:hypothetical protein n=1 Tax=Sulfurovum sp. TaxID=1969726 RepID=UPI0035678B0B